MPTLNNPTPTNPGTRAVPLQQTAVERLDIALRPFIRPGAPITFDPGNVVALLRGARFNSLVLIEMAAAKEYRLAHVGTAVKEE